MHNQTRLFPLFQLIILLNWLALIHSCIMGDVPISISYYCKTYPKTSSTISSHPSLSPALPNPCQSVEMSRLRNWFHPHSPFMSAWRWSYFKHVKTFFVSINMKFSEYTFISSYMYHLVAKFEIMRLAQNIPFCLLVVIKWLYWETQQNKGIRVVKSRERS